MNLPIAQASPIDIAGSTLSGVFQGIGSTMQSGLMQAITLASGSKEYTHQEFWDAQGTNGAQILSVFAALTSNLASVYPELLTPEIQHAADDLIIEPDGRVKVKS